jgi:hypothetical protein
MQWLSSLAVGSDRLWQRLLRVPARLRNIGRELTTLKNREEISRGLLGNIAAHKVRALPPHSDLRSAEFRVSSQWGDDGIIQYLIAQVAVKERSFVEFGVENYEEANTRFLLENDNWRGLILDGNSDNMAAVRSSNLFWRHDLSATAAFITRDNINDLISRAGFTGAIGLLSIDIDGNDYWVWKAIDVVDPDIVICEYNAVFGPDLAVTVPYDASFDRTRAHSSNLFWGCSLQALRRLGSSKGYVFVGCNSAGNNCYFVKSNLAGNLKVPNAKEGFTPSLFRESRATDGTLTYLAGEDRFQAIQDMEVYDVESEKIETLRSLRGRS